MRWLFFHNVFCLRPFLALHDFKLNVIAFLQAFVAVRLDGAVVDEHIGAVFPTDEAETLCVIEPFDFAFNSRHFLTPCVLGHCRFAVSARDRFYTWVLPLLKGGTQDTGGYLLPGITSFTRYFGFFIFSSPQELNVNP